MEEYEFHALWTPIKTNQPPSGTRCIVTDGDTIVVGTYAGEGVWVLPGIHSEPSYSVIGWMPVPKPMKKIVVYETSVDKDKVAN